MAKVKGLEAEYCPGCAISLAKARLQRYMVLILCPGCLHKCVKAHDLDRLAELIKAGSERTAGLK